MRVDLTVTNARKPLRHYLIFSYSLALGEGANLFQWNQLPLATKAWQTSLATEELLHGGSFKVALLGDEMIQRTDQRVHIRERPGDGVLLADGWQSELIGL